MLVDIKVLDFDPVFHVKHLYDWFKMRNLNLELINELPKVGCMAFYKDLGIAAAFLRMVEPHYALLDGLITNPEALAPLRSDSIDACVKHVIQKAKDLKVKSVLAHIVDAGVLKRSEKHGFKKLPDSMICLSL